jgi:hypothetical protein
MDEVGDGKKKYRKGEMTTPRTDYLWFDSHVLVAFDARTKRNMREQTERKKTRK